MRFKLQESARTTEYSGNNIKKASETIADIFTDFSDSVKSIGIEFSEFFEIYDDYNLGINSDPVEFIKNINQILKNTIADYSEKVKSEEFDRIYVECNIYASISEKAYEMLEKCGLRGYSNIRCNICAFEISGSEGSSEIDAITVYSYK